MQRLGLHQDVPRQSAVCELVLSGQHSLESNFNTEAGIGRPSRRGVRKKTEAPLKLRLTRLIFNTAYLPELSKPSKTLLCSTLLNATQVQFERAAGFVQLVQ